MTERHLHNDIWIASTNMVSEKLMKHFFPDMPKKTRLIHAIFLLPAQLVLTHFWYRLVPFLLQMLAIQHSWLQETAVALHVNNSNGRYQ